MDASVGFARIANIALGVWLFLSAYLWPHSGAQFVNAWICGIVAVIFAAAATRSPAVRSVNTLLAVWLFISAWALPSIRVVTVWNHALVAIAMFAFSLVPNVTARRAGPTAGR
jgi:hypothetical protein